MTDQPERRRSHAGGLVPGVRGEVLRVLRAGEEVLSLNDPRSDKEQQ